MKTFLLARLLFPVLVLERGASAKHPLTTSGMAGHSRHR